MLTTAQALDERGQGSFAAHWKRCSKTGREHSLEIIVPYARPCLTTLLTVVLMACAFRCARQLEFEIDSICIEPFAPHTHTRAVHTLSGSSSSGCGIVALVTAISTWKSCSAWTMGRCTTSLVHSKKAAAGHSARPYNA